MAPATEQVQGDDINITFEGVLRTMHHDWAAAITAYCAWLTAAGTSATTIRLRRYYLHRFAISAGAGPFEARLDDLIGLLSVPAWSPETRKSARAALRGFYRWAHETGRTTTDLGAGLPRVKVPPGRPRPVPEPVIGRALGKASPRERLMILLACQAGLRRTEIATLRGADLVGDQLHVRGKGGRVRVVPLHPDLVRELSALPKGWVFPGQIDGHISPGHVGKLLARALGPGWSGHTLRHRFATSAYSATRDLRAVQELLGHSKPETTARYTLVSTDALRAAVNSLPSPAA